MNPINYANGFFIYHCGYILAIDELLWSICSYFSRYLQNIDHGTGVIQLYLSTTKYSKSQIVGIIVGICCKYVPSYSTWRYAWLVTAQCNKHQNDTFISLNISSFQGIHNSLCVHLSLFDCRVHPKIYGHGSRSVEIYCGLARVDFAHSFHEH